MSNHLANNKSTLAKLLAGENITVEHKKVHTASFDVKNRVLTLPIYKEDISAEVYDTFVSHEVGHALWTPADEDIFSQRKLFAYVNLVEDIRIERMIKNKFGGLVKSFLKGYDTLFNEGFFGVTAEEVQGLGFADRLNLKAKVGCSVVFNAEEQALTDRAFKAASFTEVVDVAKAIMEYVNDNQEEEEPEQNEGQEQNQTGNASDDKNEEQENSDKECSADNNPDGEDEEDSASGKSSDGDEDEESEGNDKGSSESGDESEGEDESESTNEGDEGEDESDAENSDQSTYDEGGASDQFTKAGQPGEVKTQEHADEAMKEFLSGKNTTYTYLKYPDYNLSDFIIPYAQVAKEASEAVEEYSYYSMTANGSLDEFVNENRPVVNHMHKTFEMRKAAEISKRAMESKTGKLDVNRMYRYKYDDNIFQKALMLPEGKSHGMVMFVDWSGSMAGRLMETMKQTINLISFCKRAGIAFDVYAFVSSNYGFHDNRTGATKKYAKDSVVPEEIFKLLHLTSSSLRTASFKESLTNMWKLGKGLRSNMLGLGSTPLNSTILLLPKVVEEFKAKHKVQIVNAVILSDGHASDSYPKYEASNGDILSTRYTDKVFLSKSAKTYEIGGYHDATKRLLDFAKDVSGVNIIGFFLGNTSRSAVQNAIHTHRREVVRTPEYYPLLEKLVAEAKKERSFTIKDCGYDELYITHFAEMRSSEEDYFNFEDSDDLKESAKNVKAALRQIGKEKNKKRVIMNRFVELISKPKNMV